MYAQCHDLISLLYSPQWQPCTTHPWGEHFIVSGTPYCQGNRSYEQGLHSSAHTHRSPFKSVMISLSFPAIKHLSGFQEHSPPPSIAIPSSCISLSLHEVTHRAQPVDLSVITWYKHTHAGFRRLSPTKTAHPITQAEYQNLTFLTF
jgi:hypothetical protein